MFNWLWSLFYEDVSYNIYNPKERNIYSYLKGKEGVIEADPMPLERKLAEVREELRNDILTAKSPVAPREWVDKRYQAALVKIRAIFGIKNFEEGGLLQEELFDLLDHFIHFTTNVKKNSKKYPISVGETSTDLAPPIMPVESPPILNTLDSGSIVKEPSTVLQEPLPTVQELPSDFTPQEKSITNPLPTESLKQP